MYFEHAGPMNTEETLTIACNRAKELGISELVLASTSGETAKVALDICEGMKIVRVSYHAGFKEPFQLSIDSKERAWLEERGVQVICATHALSGIERGMAKKFPGPYPALIAAETLKMFGQGVKVAVEVSVMAADSGILSGKKIVSVGGSGKGCDAAVVLTPANQNRFFDLKIHEILCKPRLY